MKHTCTKLVFSIQIVIVLLILLQVDNTAAGGKDDVKVKYSSNDENIEILDYKNFERLIYANRRSTLMQFYANWCSSCKRFAPYFKQIAKELKPWDSMIRVAVMDCAVDDNSNICDENGVEFVPTFKFFYAMSEENGTETGNDNIGVEDFVKNVIKFVEDHPAKPKHWPVLKPLTIAIDRLMTLNRRARYGLLIFEDEHSWLGRKLILDHAKFAIKFCMRRIIKSKAPKLFEEFNVNVNGLPVLRLIQRTDADGLKFFPFEPVVQNMKTDQEYNEVDDVLPPDDKSKKDLRYIYTQMITKFIKYTSFENHVEIEL